MSSEALDTEQWLYGILSADSQLMALAPGGVHSEALPQEIARPAVVYRFQGGNDTAGVGATRILSRLDYLIEAIVDRGQEQAARDLSARLDDVLQASSGQTANLRVYMVDRQAPFRQPEEENGQIRYQRAGGIYRITVRPLP